MNFKQSYNELAKIYEDLDYYYSIYPEVSIYEQDDIVRKVKQLLAELDSRKESDYKEYTYDEFREITREYKKNPNYITDVLEQKKLLHDLRRLSKIEEIEYRVLKQIQRCKDIKISKGKYYYKDVKNEEDRKDKLNQYNKLIKAIKDKEKEITNG